MNRLGSTPFMPPLHCGRTVLTLLRRPLEALLPDYSTKPIEVNPRVPLLARFRYTITAEYAKVPARLLSRILNYAWGH